MKRLLAAIPICVVMVAPAMAQRTFLLDTVDGEWAVDGACGVPAKTSRKHRYRTHFLQQGKRIQNDD